MHIDDYICIHKILGDFDECQNCKIDYTPGTFNNVECSRYHPARVRGNEAIVILGNEIREIFREEIKRKELRRRK